MSRQGRCFPGTCDTHLNMWCISYGRKPIRIYFISLSTMLLFALSARGALGDVETSPSASCTSVRWRLLKTEPLLGSQRALRPLMGRCLEARLWCQASPRAQGHNDAGSLGTASSAPFGDQTEGTEEAAVTSVCNTPPPSSFPPWERSLKCCLGFWYIRVREAVMLRDYFNSL